MPETLEAWALSTLYVGSKEIKSGQSIRLANSSAATSG